MDKPANPATPFAEVYQSFLDDLALEGRKPSTIHRYRYNIERFEKWLVETGRPIVLASLERTVLIAYRQHLETLPQQPRGSKRRRRGGLLSTHTVLSLATLPVGDLYVSSSASEPNHWAWTTVTSESGTRPRTVSSGSRSPRTTF